MNSVHITLNYSWDAIEASNASSSAVIAPSFLDFSKVIAKIVQRISTAPTRSVNKGCWLNTTTCNHSLSIKTPGIAEFRIYQWCTWTPNAIRICSDLIIFITHRNVLFDEFFCCPEKSRLNSWWHICVHTCVFKEIKKNKQTFAPDRSHNWRSLKGYSPYEAILLSHTQKGNTWRVQSALISQPNWMGQYLWQAANHELPVEDHEEGERVSQGQQGQHQRILW